VPFALRIANDQDRTGCLFHVCDKKGEVNCEKVVQRILWRLTQLCGHKSVYNIVTMELNLVLLLIIQSTTLIVRVQGFINSTSSSLSGVGSYKPIYNKELSEISRQRHLRQFEQSFKHYSASENRREPRFISFQTKDDNIEVEIDFAIPFLSIPVKRSLSGAMGTLQNVISVSTSSRMLNYRRDLDSNFELCFDGYFLMMIAGHTHGECECRCSFVDGDSYCGRCNDWWNLASSQRWLVC
jgi:hypothetical protein